MKNKSGFTILELTIGIGAGSMLILIVGSVFYFTFSMFNLNSERIELKRDVEFSLDIISRTIKNGSEPTMQALGETLIVGDRSFYKNGTSLFYDPDINSSGDEIEVVKDKVKVLTFIKDVTINSIVLNMVFDNGHESISIDPVVYYRNKI
ncbi:MAG: hypothetical protein ABIG92_06255 [Candidatus Omnitrophota bacterium]